MTKTTNNAMTPFHPDWKEFKEWKAQRRAKPTRSLAPAGLERRSLATATSEAPSKITVRIPYNSLSEDLGGFRETISPGAFARCLESGSDVLALWDHNPDMPMARRSNGSLSLSTDDSGLSAELEDDGSSWNEDARASIRAGTVKGSSFTFVAVDDSWERVNGDWERTLLDADLIELSPCPMPAYSESQASVS
jgi:HK97 family phage prohead protease